LPRLALQTGAAAWQFALLVHAATHVADAAEQEGVGDLQSASYMHATQAPCVFWSQKGVLLLVSRQAASLLQRLVHLPASEHCSARQ
jgi:hypothetical protein